LKKEGKRKPRCSSLQEEEGDAAAMHFRDPSPPWKGREWIANGVHAKSKPEEQKEESEVLTCGRRGERTVGIEPLSGSKREKREKNPISSEGKCRGKEKKLKGNSRSNR